MKKNFVLKCLSIAMVANMFVPQSILMANNLSTNIDVYSTSNTNESVDVSNLKDGKYSVEFSLQNANNPNNPSMANNAIENPATIVVKDGQYYMSFNFKGMEIMGKMGYLKSLSYYNGSDYTLAEVESTYDIIDEHNDTNKDGVADFNYPKTLKIPLINKNNGDENGLIKAQVFIPVMDAIMPGGGTQSVLMKVKWDTIKVIEIENPDSGNSDDTLLTGVKITKVKKGNSYIDGVDSLELGEIDRFSTPEYANAINAVSVNGVEYQKYNSNSSNGNQWEMSVFGLRVYNGAFKDGNNEIIIKANGYKDKKVIFNQSNDTYTFVSQEDISNSGGETVINKKPLEEIIAQAKEIKKGNKTDDAWKALQNEIKVAENTLETAKTQEDISNAVLNLQKAMETFNNSSDVNNSNELEDGEYTLSFVANAEGSQGSSMLQGAFDPNVKLVVKDGKMTISMLNSALAQYLLDFSIESNGQYPKSECKKIGEADINGNYKLQEFTMSISDLDKLHKGAVLVTAMGGQISDIGNYDKYTKLDITFGGDIEKGWKGYQYDIENSGNPEGEKLLEKILCEKGYDTNNDGKMSPEEIANISGDLKLDNCNLTDISLLKHLSDKVTSLDLTGNNIKTLPDGLLDNMTGLKQFFAPNNKISDIPKDFFKNNKNLTWVNMSSNIITSIDSGDLKGLTSINELDLANNQIAIIAEDAFNGLDKLTTINLPGNKLIEFPNIAKTDLNNVTDLYLYNNNLKEIPKAIENMTNLENLSLDGNNITTLDNVDFSNLKALRKVDAHSNRISSISSKTFSKNTNLQELNLYDNDLTEFTADVLPMISKTKTSLRVLDLQMNNIAKIDDTVKNLIGDGKFYPQKTALELNVISDDKGNIKWSQDLSILDLLFWYDSTTSSLDKEISSVEEYKAMLEKDYAGKDIVKILDDEGYDWDIKTEVQKKNADGTFVTVNENITSEVADLLSGEFKVSENGTYRILKSIYPATYGVKDYKFSIVSNEVEVKSSSIQVDKSALTEKITEAEAIKADKYTAESFKALQEAIAKAQEILDKNDVTQEEVNAQVTALDNAIKALVEKQPTDHTNLEDGKYTVNADVYKSYGNDLSMANNAINHTLGLEVKNGKYYLTVDFNGLNVGGQLGYLSDLEYFVDGYKYQNNDIVGETKAVEVLSTQKDENGNDIIDEYNDKDHLYPNTVRFEMVSQVINDKDGYLPLKLNVPIMESIAPGLGTQKVRMKLDWTTLKIDDGSSSTEPENPTEQSPSIDFTDSKTGVKVKAGKGVLAEGTKIQVTEITSGKDYTSAMTSLSSVGKKFKLYDIKFVSAEGTEVTPNGTVDISLPIAKGYNKDKLAVYRMGENTQKTLVKGNVEESYYNITTKTSGKYTLVEKNSTITDSQNKKNNPKTSDEFGWATAILAALSAGALGIAVVDKKRKNKKRM